MKRKNHRDTTRGQQSRTLSYARCGRALVIVFWLFCGLATRACAANSNETDPIEPPVAGQPVNFSGAIGSYAISMQAEPTALEAEERILLKVRVTVTGTGSLHQIERPDLRKLPQFNKHFEIENGAVHDLPKVKTREFEYRLRPRNAEVKQIPALPFVYFNPDILPAAKGYQWAYASAIPLTVKPRSAVTSAQVQAASAPFDPPNSVLRVAGGKEVLLHEEPFAWPGWAILFVLGIAPPVVCVGWLVAWRRLNPDAARLRRQRRSRAARHAVRAIGAAERLTVDEQAPRVKEILVSYLRERFDFAVHEPTPLEASAYLQQRGLSTESAEKANNFFTACDAARFAPCGQPGNQAWTTRATSLLQALEEESWSAQAT